MAQATGLDTATPSLPEFIRHHHAEILGRWRESFLEVTSLRLGPTQHTLDDIPEFLQRLAQFIETAGDTGALEGSAARHAIDRLGEGYELRAVTQEYAVLRQTVFELWQWRYPSVPVTLEHVRRFDLAIDDAILHAVESYAAARDRSLLGLDRIAQAALESSNVELFLPRLLRVLVETAPAIDAAVLMLQEDGELRVRASIGLERQPESARLKEGFAGQVAATGHPAELRCASESPDITCPAMREASLRAMYGVPLAHGGRVIGVALMCSRSAWEFADADKTLFRTMSQRAAALIVQGSLVERERRARIEVEAALAQMDALLSASPAGIALFSSELRYVRVNEMLAQITGRTLEEHLGKTLWDIISPEDAARADRHLRQVLKTGAPLWVEFDLPTPPESTEASRHYIGIYFPIRGRTHQATGVGVIVVDISERKRAEDQLRERERALRFLAEMTRAVAEQPLESSAILNAAAESIATTFGDVCFIRLISADRQRLEMLAASSRDSSLRGVLQSFFGEGIGVLEGPSADVLRTSKPVLVPIVTDAERERLRDSFEPEHRPVVDLVGPCSYMVLPIRGHDGPIGTLTLIRTSPKRAFGEGDLNLMEEVTWRLALALENTALVDETQRAVKLREDVLAVVSHDLRTPLNTIVLTSSLLQTKAELDPWVRKHVQTIQSSAGTMQRLIGDLLDMASIQAHRLRVEQRPERVLPLLTKAVDLHQPLAEEKGLSLGFESVDPGLMAMCDHTRVLQVLSNLIGNAIKFCRPGEHVVMAAEQVGEQIRFRVSDTGPGIRPNEQSHLFDPYWSAGRFEARGTGLGLYITRGIVKAHGGEIWVESEAGRGSTFWFTLPAAAPSSDRSAPHR